MYNIEHCVYMYMMYMYICVHYNHTTDLTTDGINLQLSFQGPVHYYYTKSGSYICVYTLAGVCVHNEQVFTKSGVPL